MNKKNFFSVGSLPQAGIAESLRLMSRGLVPDVYCMNINHAFDRLRLPTQPGEIVIAKTRESFLEADELIFQQVDFTHLITPVHEGYRTGVKNVVYCGMDITCHVMSEIQEYWRNL